MAVKNQRVGLHVSAAGGVENAPENAKEFGAEVFQFFSRSPRGGKAPVISDEQAKIFREKCEAYGFESYIHTPYYVNFASKNNRIHHGSINVVQEELERGSKLGVKYVVTHMGSAREWLSPLPTGQAGSSEGEPEGVITPQAALDHAVKGLRQIFEMKAPHTRGKKKFTSELLLEISAGAGAVVGDTFEELKYLLDGLGRDDVHVCLDTAHLFASGYDLRDAAALEETMKKFRNVLGISQLKLVHINDSKVDLGGRVDRHEHIGKGYIGQAGFKALLAHKDFQHVNCILETKHDSLIKHDIVFLKEHRKQHS